MAANAIRRARLTRPDGTMLMVPMDHGISMGPTEGVSPPGPTLKAVSDEATCVTVHKGLVAQAAPFADRLGIMMHLSASTDLAPDGNDKRLVATVDEAVRRGCDGVSVHLNLGSTTEADQIEDVGNVSGAAHDAGMPLLAMVYPRGPDITNPFDPDLVAHAARLGAELGADFVKVPYTGDATSFKRVVKGAGIPVVVAGGPKQQDFAAFLASLKDAKQAGAMGVSIGRNVFQHPDPGQAMADIAAIFQ